MKHFIVSALLLSASAVHAHGGATGAATTRVATSTADDVDFKPSIKSADGKHQSHSRALPSPHGMTNVHMGVWKAEPGEYRHPGSESGETFVVTHGRGKIVIAGAGEHQLMPGTIITIPPKTASALTVDQPLRKFSTAIQPR